MDNDQPYFQNYSSYEFVSRKRKGKKKGKQRNSELPALKTNNEESDASNALESTGDSNITDDNTSDTELEQETGNTGDTEVKFVNNTNRVSVDGMMKTPPQIIYPERVDNVYEAKELTSPAVNEADKLAFEEKVETPVIQEPKQEYMFVNNRALTKHASTYELEKFEKKVLIIFNQEKIEGHKPRLGTEKDVEALTRTFKSFDFEVIEHKDLTKDDVFKELKTFSEQNFTDYGCVAVAVLTHGSNNGLLRAKDQQYSEIEIINHFKVYDKPTLVTKPKIIIIQACRGTKIVQGAPVFLAGKIRKDHDEDLEPYILPSEADMLILHSSYVGSPSHRDELYGSWFIQTLCRKIEELAPTHDLETIITEVKRDVAIDKHHEEYNKRTLEMNINKQMPVMTSTLIRKLYLKRFGDETVVTVTDRAPVAASGSSKHEVLDGGTPNTPLLVQFGPCSCFLDHFIYMRNCLRYFIEDNPHDETALNYLEVANAFEEGTEFNTAKEKMTKAICKHLINNARSCQYYKYLYLYKH